MLTLAVKTLGIALRCTDRKVFLCNAMIIRWARFTPSSKISPQQTLFK